MSRFKLFRKSISVGVVTEKYPYEPIEIPPGFRGKPKIDPSKCIGCGACVDICPSDALSIKDDLTKGIRYINLFIGRCTYCGRCQDICPVEAIKLTNEFELTTNKYEDLHQVIGLRMFKCSICGKFYATYRQLKNILEILPKEQRPYILICPECKEKAASLYTSYARR